MYSIPLKIEGIERRKRSTGILHLIAGLFLITTAGDYYEHLNYEEFLNVLPVYMVCGVSLTYGFFRKRIDPSARFNHWVRMLQFITFAILAISFTSFADRVTNIALFLWAIVT
ncbi:MAG TPA: hypothetical protein VNA26_01350, partial [Chitinophagaceae bacterium]|nr:hypothetical protein [Chitinophagaceae bacterium]